jgi:PsbP
MPVGTCDVFLVHKPWLILLQNSSSFLLPSAFGPPGRLNPRTGVSEQGDTNVSVIVSGGLSGFSLRGTLGSPTEAAEKLIRLSLAPEGSGRTIDLKRALEDIERNVYQLEYDVMRPNGRPPLRAISIIAAGSPAGTKLITLTVTAPKEVWDVDAKLATKLERIASSFHTT